MNMKRDEGEDEMAITGDDARIQGNGQSVQLVSARRLLPCEPDKRRSPHLEFV